MMLTGLLSLLGLPLRSSNTPEDWADKIAIHHFASGDQTARLDAIFGYYRLLRDGRGESAYTRFMAEFVRVDQDPMRLIRLRSATIRAW